MNKNELTLNVSIDDLKNTIENLDNGNGKFLSVIDNLFLIENINTCLHVKQFQSWFNNENISFKFSYNDDNFKNLIMIKYNFEDSTCYSFLKNSDFINKEQLNSINAKIMKTVKQIRLPNIKDAIEKADEMVFNEALIILGGAINKEDFALIKNDFETKYLAWKERINEINNTGIDLINTLYNKLIKIKLNERL